MTKERPVKVWRPNGGFGGGACYHPTKLSFVTHASMDFIHPDPDLLSIFRKTRSTH